MHWLPFVLMVLAGGLFLFAFFVPFRDRFQNLGLAFLTAGLIFEFVIRTSSGLLIIH